MFQSITTVTVDLAGEPERNIVSSQQMNSAHVQAQIGGVWVTALDRQAVAAHAYAWNAAAAEAAALLPPVSTLEAVPRKMVPTLIIRQVGWVQPQVYRVPSTGDDDAFLEVVVGALRVRAYDQLAVTSVTETWERALAVAATIWDPQPARIEPGAVGALMGRRGLPAIIQPGLPPTR